LDADDLSWLTQLPALLRFGDHVICLHATIGDTTSRIETDDEWRAQAERVRALNPETRICIYGHTHKAGATYVAPDGRVRRDSGNRVSLDGEGIWFVNPGSVGEPRDGDPRASYGIMDWPPRRVSFRRARYDRARLAKFNATRLPPTTDGSRTTITQWLEQAAARLSFLHE